MPASNLTTGNFVQIGEPVVCHVKSAPASPSYDHWVVCVATRGNSVWIYDPPNDVQEYSMAEFAARWDGTGLIVSDRPIATRRLELEILRPDFLWFLGLGAAFVVSVLWRFLASKSNIERNSRFGCIAAGTQFAVLLLASFVLAMLYHFFSDDGLLSHNDTVSQVEHAYETVFMDKLSLEKVHELIHDPHQQVMLVDARLPADFNAGHLPGAINLPTTLTQSDFDDAVTKIPRDARLIVYCESEQCPYANAIARRLADSGYSNISLFPGGWEGWANDASSEVAINKEN
jgi:rhodanese-related sulfurtransferase